jgi:hypothetical protein
MDLAQGPYAPRLILLHVPEPFIARSIPMLDVVVLAIGLVFFALSVGYTIACDRL